MFLKRIEMQGFKSFADKTRIDFDKGVTAVVGPNGSGKSNITESLRWVLGESSAKNLRGGKMPDVIFAGTENRPALNFAQVSVLLDNQDGFIKGAGTEIGVERRIYRNGDNEYLIDGKKVRLKDIHSLFMDTGLGRDSFSIISQGRVEAIFNAKPEERRAIFEEAAGVLKYKTRKRETETKLNQTQDNLDRLGDIIYELEHQQKPLAKQADVAKRFLALEEMRKRLGLSVLVEDIKLFKAQKESSDLALKQVKSDLATYYRQREALEGENQALKEKRQALISQQEDLQSELLDLTRLLADIERQVSIMSLENSQTAEKMADARQRLDQLQLKKESFQKDKAETEGHLEVLNASLVSLRESIKTLKQELETYSTSPDQIIEHLREEFVHLLQEEADLSNRLTGLQVEIENVNEQAASKSAELQKLVTDRSTLEEVTQEARVAKESAKARVSRLLKDYQDCHKVFETTQKTYQLEQNNLFQLIDQLKSKEARQQSLLTIQKNHSHRYAGVKSVLQASDQLGGIVGAVSDHLMFDQQYQTALDIALGGASQHIIVEDEAAAKRAIDYLKRKRSGRATFLPLTTIKPREVSAQYHQKLANSPGFLGFASDLITYDERLQTIFQNLLGVTAIFEHLDQANQAARSVQFQVRIVTLDGSEIRPGGAFAGGSQRQSNHLFIKPELETLTAELLELKTTLRHQEKIVDQLRHQQEDQQALLSQLKEEGEAARLSEQKAELAYEQVSERLHDLSQLCEQLSQQSNAQTLSALEQEKTAVQQQLLSLAEKKETLSRDLAKIKDDKDGITEAVNRLTLELSEAQLKEREAVSEQKFEQANLERFSQNISEMTQEMSQLEAWLAADHPTLSSDGLAVLEAQQEQARDRQAVTEQQIIRLRFELEDCDGGLEDIEEQLQKAGHQNESLIRQQVQLEGDIDKLSDQLSDCAKQLSEDYQIRLEDAKTQAEPIADLLSARQELGDLNRQIKGLGPINLEAVAQYDELMERLTFLNTQKDDLTHAKNLLLETIHEMDEEVMSRFKATFEGIRESFKQTFSQMFGGGSADLVLTEKDWLTAGVEISVQPPGKKIQSINLMSGGEKALSALALLFAIVRVKTIPFVVLDEVEAALDEANVKRFGDYLNRFDKNSQFIVVTHRKGTMAAADSIYGVTMQESGISKIVSVKLKDAEALTERV